MKDTAMKHLLKIKLKQNKVKHNCDQFYPGSLIKIERES